MLLNYIQIEKKLRKNASEIKIAQNATSELISSHCDQMKIEEALFFQWQQFCTCVPNQHQLALGWYFFGSSSPEWAKT